MSVTNDELLEYALDHLRGQAYRPFVHVNKGGRVIAYQATTPERDGDLDLAAALRAALAARPQPLFEGTVTSAPHLDHAFVPKVTIRLDEHADIALGQRVVVYPADPATPTQPCRYCDDTGQYPPPGAGMGVFPVPCPACAAGSATPTGDNDE